MTGIIETLEKQEMDRLLSDGKEIPDFSAGDTLRVQVRIREGSRERLQAFEGVCIARSGRGLNASFTVRKISFGEGIERVFPLYSPIVEAIEVKRRGRVRRAKLYYLRELRGRSARIRERTSGRGTARVPGSETKNKKVGKKNANKKTSKAAKPEPKAKPETKASDNKSAPKTTEKATTADEKK